MLETLTAESFEAHKDSDFEVSLHGESDRFTLVDVTRSKHKSASNMREPFTLIFRGGRTDAMFDQQLLDFQHPEMGTIPGIFIVPIGRLPDGRFEYQAVFN